MEIVTLSFDCTAIVLVLGSIASVVGGIAGGVLVGGKVLGIELAALMGGFYGPLAGIAGVAIGLVALMLIG
jgi:hypothetical protein